MTILVMVNIFSDILLFLTYYCLIKLLITTFPFSFYVVIQLILFSTPFRNRIHLQKVFTALVLDQIRLDDMVIFQLSKCVLFQNICHGSLLYRVHIFKFSIFRCFFRLVALCHNFCELFLLALPLDCSLVSILRHILFYLYNE